MRAGALAVFAFTLVAWYVLIVHLERLHAQPGGYYVIVQQTVKGAHCVIVNASQVTDRRAEFVEFTTEGGPVRFYVHGVSLAYVTRLEQLPPAGAWLGVDVQTCAR
jgi:hypothetical protein